MTSARAAFIRTARRARAGARSAAPPPGGVLFSAAGRLAHLPDPPRWAPWAAAAAAVVLFGFFFGRGLAQDPGAADDDIGAQYATCLTTADSFSTVHSEAEEPADDTTDVILLEGILEDLFHCSMAVGNDEIMEIGMSILNPLLIIMTIWFGVGVMFGGFDGAAVIGFLMRLGFVLMLMNNYYFDTPTNSPFGMTQGVVWTIGQQGVQIGRSMMADSRRALDVTHREAKDKIQRNRRARDVVLLLDPNGNFQPEIAAEIEETNELGFWKSAIQAFYFWFLNRVEGFWIFFIWVIGWIVYGQYLWGYVGLAVLGILGPLFIPFFLVSQLEFLFTGWLKAVINTTVYMMTAAATYAIVAMITMIPMTAIAVGRQQDFEAAGFGDIFVQMLALFFPYLPIIVITILGAINVAGLSAALVSGGTMPSAGLAGYAVQKLRGSADMAHAIRRGWKKKDDDKDGPPVTGGKWRSRAQRVFDEYKGRRREGEHRER